ncbi:MFS transporter [Chloroflexota bacterium]
MLKKIFFGWYIVAAALLLHAYSAGTIGFGFTAVIAPIAATFGWSYAQISFGASLRGLEEGTLDPFVGMAADRWPARRLMIIGVVTYGLGILCISQATNLATFYIGFVVLGLGHSLAVSMVPQTMIARWFKKNLGKASAVLSMGGPIGGVLVPVMVIMIDTYSWQTALLIVAVGMWLIGIPLSFAFRPGPKEHGILPDGKPPDDAKWQSGSESYNLSVGVKEALKMRAFWQMGIAYMLQAGPIHAVITHLMPYLVSLGVERSTASIVAMFIPLVNLTARLPFGWLADIFPKKYVFAVSIGVTSAGLLLLGLVDGDSFVLIGAFVVIFGMGWAGLGALKTPIVREYFGTKNFGTIFGLIRVFSMIGLLVYPPVAGWVYDTRGTYDPIWFIYAGLAVVGTILMLTTPNPRNGSGLSRVLY